MATRKRKNEVKEEEKGREEFEARGKQGGGEENRGTQERKKERRKKRKKRPRNRKKRRVLISIPCVLVTPKRKLAGHLAVMKNVLHFFAQVLVEGTGGSSVFRNFDAANNSDVTKSDPKHRPFKWHASDMDLQKGITVGNVGVINGNGSAKLLRYVKRHRRWSMSKIKAVHWTRYLLRYTAIEIFFSDSVAPVFLNFASQKDAKDIGSLIVNARNEYLFPKGSGKDKSGSISQMMMMEEKMEPSEGKIVENEPKNVEAMKVILFGKIRRGKATDAVKFVENLIKVEPSEIEWRLLLAICFTRGDEKRVMVDDENDEG